MNFEIYYPSKLSKILGNRGPLSDQSLRGLLERSEVVSLILRGLSEF